MVDRRRDPEADGSHCGMGLARLFDLADEQLDELAFVLAGRGLAALEADLRVGVEDADQHLRPAQIHAYRLGLAHG